MANLRLPPNVKIDPATGYYVITNRSGKSVRVSADTQAQLDTFVRSVNTNTPVTVSEIDPTTGLERVNRFDPAEIIADTDAIASQRAARVRLRNTTGLVGTTVPGTFQDINTGRTYTTQEAEALAVGAGLTADAVAASRPRNAQEISRGQTALNQRVNDPSQLANPPQIVSPDQPPAVPLVLPPGIPLSPQEQTNFQDLPAAVTRPAALDPAATGDSTAVFADATTPAVARQAATTVSPLTDPQVGREVVVGADGNPVGVLSRFSPPNVDPAQDPEVGQFTEFNAAGQPVATRINFGPADLPLSELSEDELDAAIANTPAGDPARALLLQEYNRRYTDRPGVDPLVVEVVGAGQRAADETQAAADLARQQATLAQQRRQATQGDWRVKLRLAPGASYLYRDPDLQADGILYPLSITDGVIFPYTPQITTTYNANYSPYDLTHSNYRGYFYQNSYVGEIQIQATFTAQDTSEANYLLAVIHFFRSVTKMFYGQDPQRGAPPPLVFLQGLGEFQFNLHPCAVSQFNYTLPADVDYIRARTANINGTNLLARRDRQTIPTNPWEAALARLSQAGLGQGSSISGSLPPPTLGTAGETYVPTKLEATIQLLPMQTRQQQSREFSLKNFANGNLVRGGYW